MSEPTFSIVIPTFERPLHLRRCLAAIAELDYPCDSFEVLVADDGGSVRLDDVVESVRSQVRVELLRCPHGGPAAARNFAAARAAGSHLAFTDDDCTPRADWLRALASAHTQHPGSAFGGAVRNAIVDNPYSVASQLLVDYVVDYFERTGSPFRFVTSSNFSIAACDFRSLDGFDVSFSFAGGEDRDLCHRWLLAGRALRHAPEAVVDHHHALSLKRYWRQHFNYGKGAFVFRSRCAPAVQQRVEPFQFYEQLIRYPRTVGFRQPRYALLMGLSQVANAAGFFAAASRIARRRHEPHHA